MRRGVYIAVAGNIGAGKSSLVDFLVRRFPLRPIWEPNEENPFLADFYSNMERWAFASQVHFLACKVAIHRELGRCGDHVVQDRTIWEDAGIFAEHLARSGKLSRREHGTYRSLFAEVSEGLRRPDLLIYLRCPVRVLERRIRSRGRPMEEGIPTAYLRALDRLYEEWVAEWSLSPVAVIETDRADPVTDIIASIDVHTIVDTYIRGA